MRIRREGGEMRAGCSLACCLLFCVSVSPLEAGRVAGFRILGNDIPHVHHHCQTLRNLKFTLSNEPRDDGIDWFWILNRIVDPGKVAEIQGLLRHYRVLPERVFTIPFDREYFANRVGSGYRERELYITNQNNARNRALQIGRDLGYRWVLPLDGNSFLEPSSIPALLRSLNEYNYSEASQGRLQFPKARPAFQHKTGWPGGQRMGGLALLPMIRLWEDQDDAGSERPVDCNPLLRAVGGLGSINFSQSIESESQVAIHSQSGLEFPTGLGYSFGRDNKVSLIRGQCGHLMWPLNRSSQYCPCVGMVHRLPSMAGGRDGAHLTQVRGWLRRKGMRRLIVKLLVEGKANRNG